MTWEESFLPGAPEHVMRTACEQSIFLGYLRGIGLDYRLDHTFDERHEIIAASIEYMLAAFDVFEAERVGVVLAAKFRNNPARMRLMETAETFETLRQEFEADPIAAGARVMRDRRATLEAIRSSTL